MVNHLKSPSLRSQSLLKTPTYCKIYCNSPHPLPLPPNSVIKTRVVVCSVKSLFALVPMLRIARARCAYRNPTLEGEGGGGEEEEKSALPNPRNSKKKKTVMAMFVGLFLCSFLGSHQFQ